MKSIDIINGPNLNLLGTREPDKYGSESFEQFLHHLQSEFDHLNLTYYQCNIEGELINRIQESGMQKDGILLNAGGYTHTSVAIRDAISAIECPVIEIHITNVTARESFRHESMITAVCKGLIMGFGLDSYKLGLKYFENKT